MQIIFQEFSLRALVVLLRVRGKRAKEREKDRERGCMGMPKREAIIYREIARLDLA
jgi:hypothetical protein